MALENHSAPDPAQSAPLQKTSSVRTEVEKTDKVAWVQAAKKKELSLEEWVNQTLNSAAQEENHPGGETK